MPTDAPAAGRSLREGQARGRRRGTGRLTTAALIAVAAAFAACGDDGGTASDGSSDGAGTTDGAALYAASCAACHGDDLRGTDRGPSFLSQVYEPGHHPDASFRAAAERGVTAHHWDFGDMPPVQGIDAGEIDAIVAFVRAQQREHGFEPYPP